VFILCCDHVVAIISAKLLLETEVNFEVSENVTIIEWRGFQQFKVVLTEHTIAIILLCLLPQINDNDNFTLTAMVTENRKRCENQLMRLNEHLRVLFLH